VNRYRDITGPGQARAFKDLLQSVFIGEVLHPSSPLWLYFAWTTDVFIVDNTSRQFATLCPDWPTANIRLTTVLQSILRRGGAVKVLLRDNKHNDAFLRSILQLKTAGIGDLQYCLRPKFHEKGMLGADYVIDGTMNLTLSGMQQNDEHILFRQDLSDVAQRRIELQAKWTQHLT
jgi:hypothetical protein